jgi:hypothetical protein
VYATNSAFTHAGKNNVGDDFSGAEPYENYDIIKIDVAGFEKLTICQGVCESLRYLFVDEADVVLISEAYPAESEVTLLIPATAKYCYMSVNQIPGNYLINAE